MTEHVRIEPARHVRVYIGGQLAAETTHGYVVHEVGLPDRYYVPRADVRANVTDGSGTGVCPWKGTWKHLDVEMGGKSLPNGAWTYYEATPLGAPIKELIAFYENKVDRIEAD
jgi:uncharacterized protein (DUF427 family)